MEPSDFDPKIAEHERTLEQLREQMERAAQKFKEALVTYAREWAPIEVENMVVAKPHVTKRIGPEGIKRLKS